MSDSRRVFSVNRDAAPPPLLPERSDASELEGSFRVSAATASFSPHSSLDRRSAGEQAGDRPCSSAQSTFRSRAIHAFLNPTTTPIAASSSSPTRTRTASLFSTSSGCPSLTSASNRSVSSCSFPVTPYTTDFGMLISADDPPAPRAPRKEGPSTSSLPYHARPHSKWDPSLIVEEAPIVVTTGPPIAQLAPFGSQHSSLPASTSVVAAGRSTTARPGQGSSTRPGVAASVVGTSGLGLFADGPIRSRDNSYLSRLAPNSSSFFAHGRSVKPSPAARPQTPYVVRDSDAVREMEVLLLESIRWNLLDGRTSFVEIGDGQPEPARVLDIGCGTGVWCIATAVQWTTSHFVGFDMSTGQTDLAERARYQQQRAESRRQAGRPARSAKINWDDLDSRIEWVHGNFLEMLPFDTRSFDLVRIAFGNLGIPESSWQDVLEECTRVLERGTGILEIVELSGDLPRGLAATPPRSPALGTPAAASTTPRHCGPTKAAHHHARSDSTSIPSEPTSRKAFFDSHLHRHMVQALPDVTIRSSLLMQSGMSKSREVFRQTYRRSPTAVTNPSNGGIGSAVSSARFEASPGFIGAAMGVWIEAMAPALSHSPAPVFPSLHKSITRGLLINLAARGVQWAEPGRFPSGASSSKRNRRRSLMLLRSQAQEQDPGPDLGTLSLHAWVGVKSGAGLP